MEGLVRMLDLIDGAPIQGYNYSDEQVAPSPVFSRARVRVLWR